MIQLKKSTNGSIQYLKLIKKLVKKFLMKVRIYYFIECLEFSTANVFSNSKGIELSKLAFRCIETVKIGGLIGNIEVNFSLKEDSSFYLFTRDIKKISNLTSVIRINRESGNNKCHISLGTFINDGSDLQFKVFSKQQLVDFNSKLIFLFRTN